MSKPWTNLNRSSKKFSKLNVKSSKRVKKDYNSSHLSSQNQSNYMDSMKQKSITNLIKKSSLLGISSESRSHSRGMNFHSIKSRPSQGGINHSSSMHKGSNLGSSISKMKSCTLNSSSSTALLRSNGNIINIKNGKQRKAKYDSVSKFTKRNSKKENIDHTKTFSMVKDMVGVDRF